MSECPLFLKVISYILQLLSKCSRSSRVSLNAGMNGSPSGSNVTLYDLSAQINVTVLKLSELYLSPYPHILLFTGSSKNTFSICSRR